MRVLISLWQPEKKLTKTFLAQVRQGIEQRQRWLDFWRGIWLALTVGVGILGLAAIGWLIKDLYCRGFFLTLLRPDLYLSLTGLNLMVELIPWENLIFLAASLWLVGLLINRQKESNYG